MAEPMRLAIAGSWQHHGSPWPRRAGITAAVATLHFAMLIALLLAQALTRRPPAPASPEVIWLELEDEASEPAIIETIPPLAPAPTPDVVPATTPAAAPALPPAVSAASQSSPVPTATSPTAPMTIGNNPIADQKALDALKPYILCGVPSDGRPIPDNARPCDTIRWGLATRPAEPRSAPTDTEQALQREFERAYAVETSPVLLPCAAGLMVDPLCLVGGMLNGFDFKMGSYGNMGDGRDCGFGEAGSRLCGTSSSKPTVGGVLGR